MITGGVDGVDTPVGCAGTTNKNLSVDFLTNCITPDVMAGGVALYIAGIVVRHKKPDVLLFFSTMQLDFPHPVSGETLYESDRLSATIVDGEPGDFHITVTNPPGGVLLTKIHEPNKFMTLDPIAIGNIVYIAN